MQEHPYPPRSPIRGTDESENRQEKAAGHLAKVYFAMRYCWNDTYTHQGPYTSKMMMLPERETTERLDPCPGQRDSRYSEGPLRESGPAPENAAPHLAQQKLKSAPVMIMRHVPERPSQRTNHRASRPSQSQRPSGYPQAHRPGVAHVDSCDTTRASALGERQSASHPGPIQVSAWQECEQRFKVGGKLTPQISLDQIMKG
jgi:hypothetical protein